MKIFCWNVNGIRAIAKKGFIDWFHTIDADILCLQETKAQLDQLDQSLHHPGGFDSYWHSAEKKGYSGVVVYSSLKAVNCIEGLGIKKFDDEGRVLQVEYKDFVLINCYFPNTQRMGDRVKYKVDFCKAIYKLNEKWRSKGKHVVMCGDYNIAHHPIDLARPKENEGTAGYLPEERAWMDKFTDAGYVDTYRHFHPDLADQYTWWSYRSAARERNVGWRIDYHTVNSEMKDRLLSVKIHGDVMGSDHCPIELEIKD